MAVEVDFRDDTPHLGIAALLLSIVPCEPYERNFDRRVWGHQNMQVSPMQAGCLSIQIVIGPL
jgi:hypothetical protein